MATYSSNTTLRYSAAASSGGVVPANSFAVVTYTCTSTTTPSSTGLSYGVNSVITRMYPAGATVLASFTAVSGGGAALSNFIATYTFASGVVLANSP
jgi:hypothetical protein